MNMPRPIRVLGRSSRIATESHGADLVYVVLLVLIVSGLGRAQAEEQPARPDFSGVVSLMRERVASGVPSIAIAIADHGRIVWEEAIGMSDRERNITATVHTPYYLASISKTITATALLELVEHKQVNLDRPVNDYLHAARINSPMWDVSKATVRRVANHTAGLATYDRDCLVSDRDCDPSAAVAIRRYGAIVWPPGDQFDYSNLDYGILGEVVAQASHASLPVSLQRRVFAPLGMTDCFLDVNVDRTNSAAARYDSSPPFSRSPPKRSTAPGASSAYCSVHDLAMFGMFHLKDHLASQKSILSDRSIDQMQAPSLSSGEEFQYGLSWWVQENLNGFHGVLAQGGTNDATAYLQLIPSEDIAIAMLWNTGTPDGGKVVDQVLSALIPRYRENLEAAAAAKPTALSAPAPEPPPAMLGAWSGFVQTYRGRAPLALDVSASGQLVARLGAEPEVRRAHPRFGEGVVRWTMPGSLGVEGEPFDLAMRLYLHGNMLVGAARTLPTASNDKGVWVYYWAQLEKK
jgi:CubicO group peptidase (beta-lactamase class C family)